MPLTTGRKAVRFKSLELMQGALSRNEEYQHRHLIFNYLIKNGSSTRREVSEVTGIPVNAISKVVNMLVREGSILEGSKIPCPLTGRLSKSIRFNGEFKGPY